MTINPHKYVVFKRDDLDEIFRMADEDADAGRPSRAAINSLRQMAAGLALSDCVVIRHQDVFAASAFYEYANQIRTTIEVMTAFGIFDLQAEERMTALADFFQDQAERASATRDRRLPD